MWDKVEESIKTIKERIFLSTFKHVAMPTDEKFDASTISFFSI
jgi:hypothetical protein